MQLALHGTGASSPRPALATPAPPTVAHDPPALQPAAPIRASPAGARGVTVFAWRPTSGDDARRGARELVELTVDSAGKTGDPIADAALANARRVSDWLRSEHGRNGIDGNGRSAAVVVHAPDRTNAYWSSDDHRVELGDGDGRDFAPLGGSLGIVAHELLHGVIESEVDLDYVTPQQAALHESFADVLSSSLTGTWTVGADVYTPDTPGDSIRDLRRPDIDHMSRADRAHGQAHALSGIASLAAVRAAQTLGMSGVGQVWYGALVNHLPDGADFSAAARATIAAAASRFGDGSANHQAVVDAWESVGITG